MKVKLIYVEKGKRLVAEFEDVKHLTYIRDNGKEFNVYNPPKPIDWNAI